MKISNQALTYIKPIERPEEAQKSGILIKSATEPKNIESPYDLPREMAAQKQIAQQRRTDAALASVVRNRN